MDEKTKSSNLVTFSLGALIGVLSAVAVLFLQRILRIAPRLNQDSLIQPYEDLPVTDTDQGMPIGQPQGAVRQIPAVRANPPVPTNRQGIPPTASAAGAVDGPRWTTPTKYIMGVILFLGALMVLIIGRGVIPMVIFAALLALFINPFIQLLNRRLHLKWAAAVALTYVLVILVLLLIPLLVIPNVLAALNFLLVFDYQQLASQAAQALTSYSISLQGNPALNSIFAPLLDSLVKALENFSAQGQVQPANVEVTLYSLSSQLADKLGALVDIIGPIFAVVVSTVLTLLMALQMSLAANQISGWYPDLIPPAYKVEYTTLFEKISQTWISFLRGQLTLMLIIGVTIWIGNLALGVPAALLMGVLAGLLELIPNIGPTLAAIPAVLLALIFGSTYLPIDNLPFALLVVGFYVLIQFLENQFIVPYVMGDAVDLPPLIVLIGTLAGASAFGILGALLATPVIATGNLIFRYIYRKILEPPPIPVSLEQKPSIWESVKGWARRIPLRLRKKQVTDAPTVARESVRGGLADGNAQGKS